jgi:hypothetical protein
MRVVLCGSRGGCTIWEQAASRGAATPSQIKSNRFFCLISSTEKAFIGSSKLPTQITKIIFKIQVNSFKSIEKALAAVVCKKAEINEMLARLQVLSNDHFKCSPDDVTWDHVGTLGYYAEMPKRVTDSAFQEGECAE